MMYIYTCKEVALVADEQLVDAVRRVLVDLLGPGSCVQHNTCNV